MRWISKANKLCDWQGVEIMIELLKCVVTAVIIIVGFAGVVTYSGYLISKTIDKKKLNKNKKNN